MKSLVLRAGDFFGPAAPNSALGWLTMRGKRGVQAVFRPGRAAHAFAYLPDLAEAAARLVEREAELADFDTFHFAGHWLGPDDLGDAIRRVTDRPRLPVLPFPHALIWAMAPFDETMREMVEMRYLWSRPIGLDNAKLVAFLGAEPHTPLDAAIAATLAGMGALPSRPRAPQTGRSPMTVTRSIRRTAGQ